MKRLTGFLVAILPLALASTPLPVVGQGLQFLCKGGAPCVDLNNREQMTPFPWTPDPEEEVLLVIVSPVDDAQVVFNSEDHGVLRIRAAAWVDPPEYAPYIEWEMDAIGPVEAEIIPQEGPAVEIVFYGLPENNSDFGAKTIRARVRDASDEVTVEVFFNGLARNNPGPDNEPNWVYYWRQTSAAQGIDFVYQPSPAGSPDPGENRVIGRYLYDADRIELYDALATDGCSYRADGSYAWSIDCFAETLRHENWHRQELKQWWDHRTTGPADSGADPADLPMWRYSARILANLAGQDVDFDMVPTEVEMNTPGCSWLRPRSCPLRPDSTLLDLEMNAYWVGWSWPLDSVDDEDWAAGGKQWRR